VGGCARGPAAGNTPGLQGRDIGGVRVQALPAHVQRLGTAEHPPGVIERARVEPPGWAIELACARSEQGKHWHATRFVLVQSAKLRAQVQENRQMHKWKALFAFEHTAGTRLSAHLGAEVAVVYHKLEGLIRRCRPRSSTHLTHRESGRRNATLHGQFSRTFFFRGVEVSSTCCQGAIASRATRGI
jgi:hypothetical protein